MIERARVAATADFTITAAPRDEAAADLERGFDDADGIDAVNAANGDAAEAQTGEQARDLHSFEIEPAQVGLGAGGVCRS